MSIYNTIYYNLCSDKKQLKNSYCVGSGLHKHHIIPRHMGGQDIEDNYTYLTVREHTIAHFLLWKIHKHPNDLRAMYMLGANLTTSQRRITGEFARDNKLGIYGCTPEQRREWGLKGLESQKQSGKDNTFYFWSTEAGRKKRASMGGKASFKNNIAFQNNVGCFKKDRTKASAAAKISGKIPVTDGTTTRKFKSRIDADDFLKENVTWRYGTHHPKPSFKGGISSRRKKVTDGEIIFDSIAAAASFYGVSSATINNWCKSSKKSEWNHTNC